jgi:hypothetical protein
VSRLYEHLIASMNEAFIPSPVPSNAPSQAVTLSSSSSDLNCTAMLAHPDTDARTPFSKRSSSHLAAMAEATNHAKRTAWIPASADELVSTILGHRHDRQFLPS